MFTIGLNGSNFHDALANLMCNTTRISTYDANSDCILIATGFLILVPTMIGFDIDTHMRHLLRMELYLVINKHTINDAVSIRIEFPARDCSGKYYDEKAALLLNISEISILQHPDADLAIINIQNEVDHMTESAGAFLFTPGHCLPSEDELADIPVGADIYMMGYPNGMWDEYNRLPIIRKGIAASMLEYDFNNEPEFLVDISCYPGSSGSPVFYIDTYPSGVQKFIFLGVLRAEKTYYANGVVYTKEELRDRKEPRLATFQSTMNLGHVIKAEVLLYLTDQVCEVKEGKIENDIFSSFDGTLNVYMGTDLG